MQNNNNIYHSAEGSTWTKKNHKYIRKEGNRYIYPSDLKKISQQHANRQNAKNGKLINPTATYRDENGNVALRLHMKGAYSTPNQADYKQYSKEMSNQAKRKRAAGGNGARNQQYAKSQNARQAVNRQGSNTKGYNYAKNENDWRQYQPGTISAKRKRAMYLQGTGNGIWRDPQTADQAKNLNEFRSNFFGAKVQDYSRSVKANKGKEFVNKLKVNLGEISAKKDQLAKKAKDFFHRLSAKYDEKRYLSKMYDENSGRPKSYNKYEGLREASGTLGSTTGNAGGGNLRVGVEAGRRRAGIKKSGNVSGLENNLRNKGYNASTDANWDNSMDNFHGSYNKRGTRKLDGTSYNDLHASRQKHDNEAIRQNRDRVRTAGGSLSPDELKRGTKAGQQRVNRKKASNGNGAKNQQYAKANPGIEALKYGKAPTPYTDKERTLVDVSKYKDMKFTDKELSKIRKIDSDLRKLHERRDQEAIDKYYDNLSDRDTALYLSYNRRNIANSPKVTGVSLSGSSNSNKTRKK